MSFKLKFSQYNERSILIEWPAIIGENILQNVLEYKHKIENLYVKEFIEVINTYSSILIIYNTTIENVNDVFLDLKTLYSNTEESPQAKSEVFKIPVCYDPEFGMDLEPYSNKKKMSVAEIIKRHTEAIYTVYFIGFLPGFLYLGGLDSKLHLDRKTTPNLNVKKGSVAIGGKQTGIYPQNSPGGWHIIGNSPIELFAAKQNPPCFIKAGDKIKFQSISKDDYVKIQKDIENSNFDLKYALL